MSKTDPDLSFLKNEDSFEGFPFRIKVAHKESVFWLESVLCKVIMLYR